MINWFPHPSLFLSPQLLKRFKTLRGLCITIVINCFFFLHNPLRQFKLFWLPMGFLTYLDPHQSLHFPSLHYQVPLMELTSLYSQTPFGILCKCKLYGVFLCGQILSLDFSRLHHLFIINIVFIDCKWLFNIYGLSHDS